MINCEVAVDSENLLGANMGAKIYIAALYIIFGTSADYNFPIGTPSSEQKQTVKTFIERHLNILREKELLENDKKALGLDV